MILDLTLDLSRKKFKHLFCLTLDLDPLGPYLGIVFHVFSRSRLVINQVKLLYANYGAIIFARFYQSCFNIYIIFLLK